MRERTLMNRILPTQVLAMVLGIVLAGISPVAMAAPAPLLDARGDVRAAAPGGPLTMAAPRVVSGPKDRGDRFRVTWRAPRSAARVEAYQLAWRNHTLRVTATRALVSGLRDGVDYRFRVRAITRAGRGPWSPWSKVVRTWDRSAPVTAITTVSDCPAEAACRTHPSTYVGRVSFTAPADTGGHPVVKYRWSTGARSGVVPARGTQIDVGFAGPAPDQRVTIVPITNVPGVGEVSGTPASGGAFSPFAKPHPPRSTCRESHYRSVRLCWDGGDGNGRATVATEYRGSARGSTGGAGGAAVISTTQGGDRACVQTRTRASEGLWSDWSGDLCANAAAREIRASVEAVGGNPPGPCTSNCDSITVHLAGYQSSRTYHYASNIVDSSGAVLSGAISTSADGRASKVVAYYDRTVYDETYCVTVDGPQACVRGRRPAARVAPRARRPLAMRAPVVRDRFAARDGRLHLAWSPPRARAKVRAYELSWLGRTLRVRGTRAVVRGLTNGTGYRFRVRALTRRNVGPWSRPSEEGVPFTRPSVMGAPVLVASNDDGRSGGYLEVSWPAVTSPEDGYDDVTEYTVELLRDGASQGVFGVGTALSKSFDVENGYEYTARVRATNRAGTSEFSALSAASISWDRSRAVSSIAKVSDCPEGASCRTDPGSYVGRVSFAAPSDTGGYPVTAYRWSTGGRSGVSDGAGTQFDVSFAGVGGGQDVTITPVTEVPGVGATDGTPSAGGGFSPFAKPRPPGATCLEGHYRSVRLCWNGGDGNGRGTDATEYRGSAGGTRGGGGGDVTIGTSQGGDRACVQVRTRTTEGLWSDWTGDLCANAAPREINASVAPYAGDPPGPCTTTCDSITVRIAGYRSSRSYSYSTNIAAGDGAAVSGSLQTDGDGRASHVVAYYDRTVYDETYCINVDGLEACVRGGR
jgi:hypothetical protein